MRPERVTTGTIRFPHFGQRVVRSMRSSRFCTPDSELELLFHSSVSAKQEDRLGFTVRGEIHSESTPNLLGHLGSDFPGKAVPGDKYIWVVNDADMKV